MDIVACFDNDFAANLLCWVANLFLCLLFRRKGWRMAELRKRHTEAAAAAEDSDKGQEIDSDPVCILLKILNSKFWTIIFFSYQ